MPDSPRIDAHAHIWDAALMSRFDWLTEDLSTIRRPFSKDELGEHLLEHAMDGVVLVQTLSATDETKNLLALAAREPAIAGVVGWVDLTAADVAQEIARFRALPGGDKLVGIRHQVHDEPDPEWLLQDSVVEGLRAVAEAGMAYDLLVRPRELAAAAQVVERVPTGRFVLDHIAKPSMAVGNAEEWREGISALAAHDHVACKLSGMVTEADWHKWTAEDIRPYADHVLMSFGPTRVLFGSDWPVATLAASYTEVVALAAELTSSLSASDQRAFWGGNAARWYGLQAGTHVRSVAADG